MCSTFQAVLWRYKFSQLKGSSDDGKSKIKFLFQNQDSKSIEAKVICSKRVFNAARRGKSDVGNVECWFCLSCRSWSSRTSSPCFTVFTLFSLPKLLAWTRCLWRAKAPRPPLDFLLFPVSHVIHRHLSSNTPLDRRSSPRTPSEMTLDLDATVA